MMPSELTQDESDVDIVGGVHDIRFTALPGDDANGDVRLEMLNPGLFFNVVRDTKKRKSVSQLLGPTGKASRPELTIHQAARDGQIEIVKQYILKAAKDKKKLNKRDKDDSTAVHYAVRYGHYNIVKLLVDSGASVNVHGEYGATPLHYAARSSFKTSRYAIDGAAASYLGPSTTSSPTLLNRKNRGLRSFMNQRLSTVKKEDLQQRSKGSLFLPLQRSLKNLVDRSATGNSYKGQNADHTPKPRKTIHNSLETLEKENLLPKHVAQTQSNIELQNICKNPTKSGDIINEAKPCHNKFPDAETSLDSEEGKNIDALMLPEVIIKHPGDGNFLACAATIKPSKSLPEVSNIIDDNNDADRKLDSNKHRDTKSAEEMILLYLLKNKADVNASDVYGSTPLHFAAMRNKAIAARHLLNTKGIMIEAKDRTKMTPLHCACSNGAYDVCALLLECEAKILKKDEEDMTPLHFAAMEGHLEIVKLLFEVGERNGGYTLLAKMIMDQDRDDQTALHLAVENGHTDIVKLCIGKGANINFVKANMITPLHLACTSGQSEIVEFLVENEADIEAKNVLQETPLHRAALFNKYNTVEYLLDRGAEIDCRDKDKETPLLMAIRKNNMETVRLLIARGANIMVKEATDKTCLYIAAEDDCCDVIDILREIPKVKNLLEEFDKNENTPLHVAATNGHFKIVETLLDMGSLIDAKNDQNLTPLHLAARFGRSRVVNTLLEQETNLVKDEDDSSNTPLHLAALEGHVTVVESLLNYGADVDARNAMLWTPLDCAASRGWTWCAECLLNEDSLIDPTDRAKTTPLHLASKEGHVDMIRLLLDHKADIRRRDHLGRNCLDLAIENNHRGVAAAIVNSENWKLALRNCTVEGGNKVTTPMRKLINKLPDVAELVFDKCIQDNGLPPEHADYQFSCSYEFLEDGFTDWGPLSHGYDHSIHESKKDRTTADQDWTMDERVIGDLEETRISAYFNVIGEKLKLPGYMKQQTELKRNHVLKFLVRNERTRLLSHPLVTYLLRHKWGSVGRYIYYSRLLLYMVYLMFITGYALTDIADEYKCHDHNHSLISMSNQNADVENCLCVHTTNNTYNAIPSQQTRKIFIDFGRYAIVFLVVFSLLMELVKFIAQLHHFFSIHNLIECLTYVIAMCFVMERFQHSDGSRMEIVKNSRCRKWHQSLGALTVWLSWINLVLFMRKFPKLGIYVVMFTDIFKTFAQFFVVFALFIIAFGLGFHMLLYEQKPDAFTTPMRAMLKTTMGMLGEFEYDTVFNGDYTPVTMSWLIYMAYLVICCIILMNLLVGLAVDDIKGVQEKAVLKRLAMQVDLALEVEKALPLSIQRKLVKMNQTIFPNAEKTWSMWSFWSEKTTTTVNSKSSNLSDANLIENIRSLKNKVKTLEAQNGRLETMMDALLKHHGIQLNVESNNRR